MGCVSVHFAVIKYLAGLILVHGFREGPAHHGGEGNTAGPTVAFSGGYLRQCAPSSAVRKQGAGPETSCLQSWSLPSSCSSLPGGHPPTKGSTTSQNSAPIWRPCVQTHKPVRASYTQARTSWED